jgi:hypothetical protein
MVMSHMESKNSHSSMDALANCNNMVEQNVNKSTR